jgi:hypothetical protein
VHGLLVDIETGRLEWLVNGYASFAAPAPVAGGEKWTLPPFELGKMNFPEGKIGDVATPPAIEQRETPPPILKVKVKPPQPPSRR